MEKLIGIDEVAEILSVKVGTLYSWVWQQRIPHLKVNGALRFRTSEIEAFIAGTGTTETVRQQQQQQQQRKPRPKHAGAVAVKNMVEQAKAEVRG